MLKIVIFVDRCVLQSTRKLHINIHSPHHGESANDFEVQLDHTQHANDVRIVDVLCKRKSGQTPFCRVLLTTSDAALLLLQQGRTKWTREEALADVVAVEMIDLQLSDAEGSIESELKNKDGTYPNECNKMRWWH